MVGFGTKKISDDRDARSMSLHHTLVSPSILKCRWSFGQRDHQTLLLLVVLEFSSFNHLLRIACVAPVDPHPILSQTTTAGENTCCEGTAYGAL